MSSGHSQPDLPPGLFWKEYKDPVSEGKFLGIAVKSSASSVRGRGTDFGPMYDGINPLHYAVIVTPSGLAAEEQVLKRSPRLLFRDRDALVEKLKPVREETKWLQPRSVEIAALAYDRALICLEFMKVARSEQASLAMKASWIYRELMELDVNGADERYKLYRKFALDKYLEAYEKEDLSTLKVGYAGIAYLIGELMRERGEFDDSLRWLSRVVTDRDVGGEVKRMARNQLDLCKEQREQAKESGDYTPPEPQRTKMRSMYQLYHDQVRWLANASAKGELNESDLMRALLDGIKNSKLDISQAQSEEHLANFIQQRLQGKPNGE